MFNAIAVTTRDGYLGYWSDSKGTATVTGNGSQWNHSGNLYIGREGNGTLTIAAGGTVSSTRAYFGFQSDSTGTATIMGIGSRWENSSGLYLGEGYGSNGTLTIDAGGSVSSAYGYLGLESYSTGTATVTGSGSRWENEATLNIGYDYRSSGTLTIEAGGFVSNTHGNLGYDLSTTGSATVSGRGSHWNNAGDLSVGRSGSGSLTITDGGLVTVAGRLRVGRSDSSINMSTGGMLAIYGEASDSFSQFLDLVNGSDAIRYWDESLADWSPLVNATIDDDYSLKYLTTGDLAGYTLLRVGNRVPEPGALILILASTPFMALRSRRQ